MSCSNTLIIIGLVMNTLASSILIFPFLSSKRNLDDDLIISGDAKKQEYTQIKHLKERTTNILGLTFLMLGFIFQIIALVI